MRCGQTGIVRLRGESVREIVSLAAGSKRVLVDACGWETLEMEGVRLRSLVAQSACNGRGGQQEATRALKLRYKVCTRQATAGRGWWIAHRAHKFDANECCRPSSATDVKMIRPGYKILQLSHGTRIDRVISITHTCPDRDMFSLIKLLMLCNVSCQCVIS